MRGACGWCGVVLWCCVMMPSAAQAWGGVVTRVADGDTVWIRPDGSTRSVKLRLQGIDAPEICQPWGREAAEALAAKLMHQHVEVDARASDDYGRLLGRLFIQSDDLAQWMVLRGHAWSYRHRGSSGPYSAEEQQARTRRLGLFADDAAQEPRWFRKHHGPCH